jgi:hypothetical protein
MNQWQQEPTQRLKLWRRFRNDLNKLDDDDALQQLTDWWKTAPVAARVIDPYDNTNWPDPWELIYNDQYDENTVTLGMCYTLQLIEWPCTLQLVQCNQKNEIKLILLVDDKHVLNYSYGMICDVSEISHCEILHSWESNELTR